MAANLSDVDLTTLTSSTQIFSSPSSGASRPSYTLPQIRALHKQIHLAIDDKKARLRTQVGGSYRELLGTADAIVRMRGDMDTVQGILGTMGARCGRGVVGSKVGGLAKFVGESEGMVELGSGKKIVGAAAKVKLLASCVLVLGRLLKGSKKDNGMDGEALLVAAKVLVLGRLLTKSFEADPPDTKMNAGLKSSIQSLDKLGRRVRSCTNRVLETVGETMNRGLVLKALCAYSLATNAGARDVIRHFLDVRGHAMASTFDAEEQRTTLDVVTGLGLYTKTILDVQFLVPNRLTEALLSLKKEPLLSDPSLCELEGLRLDIYKQWCSEAIRAFRPSMRHDDLEGRQAVDMLTSWSFKGNEVLVAGLEKTLERTTEFKTLTEMRTEVLQLWIRDGGKARGFDPSAMLDRLRHTINTHIAGVIDAKVHKLRLVGSEVAATLEVWRAGSTHLRQGLWDVGSLDMDLHHGVGVFAQDVVGRLYGRNDAVARAVTGYKSWAQVIDDVEGVVEQLKRQRWDNDVDEIEDEETIDQRQQALSRDDPARLQTRLDAALERAFGELEKQLSELWTANENGEKGGKIAMYLLRILRDIRAKLPKLATVKSFGLQMVPSLQEKIASAVATAPVNDFAVNFLVNRTVVGRSLWEGDPELPTSPSPAVFRLLRSLTMAMSEAGTDLWSPTAVSVLKKLVIKELAGRWDKALNVHVADVKAAAAEEKPIAPEKSTAGEEKPEVGEETLTTDGEDAQNDETEKAAQEGGGEPKADEGSSEQEEKKVEEAATEGGQKDAEEVRRTAQAEALLKDTLIQWLFDIALLRCSISSVEAADELQAVEQAVWKKTDLESTSARQRLAKISQEYWKRSGLLFGLLGR